MSIPTGSEQKETGPPVVMNPQTLVTCKMSVPTRSEQKKTELPVVKKLQTLVIVLCQYPLGQNEGNRTTCSNEATNLGYSTAWLCSLHCASASCWPRSPTSRNQCAYNRLTAAESARGKIGGRKSQACKSKPQGVCGLIAGGNVEHYITITS